MTKLAAALLLLAVASAFIACGGRTSIDALPGAGGATSGCRGNADCPSGDQCSTITHTCVPTPYGCQSDADCAAPTPHCSLDTHACAECTQSSQCPSGEECWNFQCVASCASGQACMPPALICCSPFCVNTDTNFSDCGTCGNACGPYPRAIAAKCVSGTCAVDGCAPGFADCDGIAANGCETDTTTDPNNCGVCTHECVPGVSCINGGCGVCSGGPGCEASLETCCSTGCSTLILDVQNCGSCGNACAAGEGCNDGTCAPVCNIVTSWGVAESLFCTATEQCCPNGCSDLITDATNCGACGQDCSGFESCVNGNCTCNGGPVCSAGECCNTGCSSLSTDSNNCGKCGHVCPSGKSCSAGVCIPTCNGGPACTGGHECCPTGCSDTTSDPENCGGCGQPCAPADSCVMGECVAPTTCNSGPACLPSQTCCSTGCADTNTDSNNCGTCGRSCGPLSTCVGGTCASNEGAFDPMVNPTYLPAGAHSYTSINIPAGVTVYVTGGGPASGTLDLSSSGPIVIDGTIDVSGGPGTQGRSSQGTAGSGGYTGEPTMSAPPSLACEFIAGNPGANGFGIAGSEGSCPVLVSGQVCPTGFKGHQWMVFTAPVAQYGGGAGVFAGGRRAFGSGGGGPAGGAPGALCPTFVTLSNGILIGEVTCYGASGGGGAINGQGGYAGSAAYNGTAGVSGETQCPGFDEVPPACVGGGGGGSIGVTAANDLAVLSTFRTGSSGGGGSGDYEERPGLGGGTSGGGGGGGALRLTSPVSITIGSTGKLLANGGAGGDADIGVGQDAYCFPQPGAAGGGGSGGVIYLASPSLSVAGGALVSAIGGPGGAQSEFATGGAGGAGGLGRIRLSITPSTCTVGGTFNPPLASGCTPAGATPGNAYVGAYPN